MTSVRVLICTRGAARRGGGVYALTLLTQATGEIIWRIQLDDADVASVRYRCLIPVRHLEELGVRSRLSWGPFDPFAGPSPAAIVFVKAFRDEDAQLAERAVAAGVAVVLDVCDNIFSESFRRTPSGPSPDAFRRMAHGAAAIVTTGPALAEALRDELGPRAPLHIVADPVETIGDVRFAERRLWRERLRNGRRAGVLPLARSVALGARAETLRAARGVAARRAATSSGDGLPQVIWYGNTGYVRPRFGIVNLVDVAPQLEAAAARTPFRLLVVSGDAAAYREQIEPLALPTAFARWDRRGIFGQLRASALALVPNSRDDFAIHKSPNRAVMALHHGVPVVATRTPALEPLAGCVGFDDFDGEVSAYLSDPARGAEHVGRAQAVIERDYAGPVVARAWQDLLANVPSR
jgi:glycosyltransferase involved in cell wall biosynthesis